MPRDIRRKLAQVSLTRGSRGLDLGYALFLLSLVAFSSYEVKERAPYMGETRLSVGELTWKRITRGMVEVLVGALAERGEITS